MDRRMDGFTDVLDAVSFGLIGVAVIAVGVASLGAAPRVDVRAPVEAEVVQAAVYDVDLSSAAAWLGAELPDVEGPERVGEDEAPSPEVALAVPELAGVVELEPNPAPARVAPKADRPLPPRKSTAAAGRARGKRCEVDPDPLITAVDGGYVVREAVIQRYTRDWSRLDQLGWSEVHRGADGKADGMRIGGIRCGSDPWDAGFRTGDVIHAVNGRKVRSIPGALAAYAALHGQEQFAVELTRGGQRRTVRFTLVRAG